MVQPVIKVLASSVGKSIFERIKIKWKLRKIKKYNGEFDGNSLESNALQNFLNQSENTYLISDYVFEAKYLGIEKDQFVVKLSELALAHINEYRENEKLEKLEDHKGLEPFFFDLVTYFENYRNQKFTSHERDLIANVQTSIIESNNDLKEYLKNNFKEIQEQSYLKSLSEEKVKHLLERSIQNLDRRYIEEAHVETNFEVLFDELTKSEQIMNQLARLVNNMSEGIDVLIESLDKYEEVLGNKCLLIGRQTSDYLNQIDFHDLNQYKEKNLLEFMDKISYFVRNAINTRNFIDEFSDEDIKPETKGIIKSEIRPLIGNIQTIENSIDHYIQYLKRPEILKFPYLLLHGEAGIGKSHLLADNARRLQDAGHSVFLFLGQHLTTHDAPFKQLFNQIDFKGSTDSFLEEFNRRAKEKNKRSVIMIDALNEGQGQRFWKNHLLDFLNTIKEYEYIAVVLSVRNNYMRSILPEGIEESFPLQMVEHKGLEELSLEALEPFFEYYGVNAAIFPALESECYNPLFLHMYCSSVQGKYNSYYGWSILELLEKYINKANTQLSNIERFNYIDSLNLVDKILRKIAVQFIEEGSTQIELDELYSIVKIETEKFIHNYPDFVNGLIEENILSIYTNYVDNKSFVHFTYERFADLYISLILLEEYQKGIKSVKQIIELNSLSYDGILEGLSIVFPEKKGNEFLDLFELNEISLNMAEAFISGLSWRNIQSIDQNALSWVKLFLNKEENFLPSLVYEKILKHAYIPSSPLNAEFLHSHLNNLSMARRDQNWTMALNNDLDMPMRFINIIINESSSFQNFTSHNLELLSTTITWCLTSTNQRVRDSATVALTTLYIHQPTLILFSLKRFINVDDPYVTERLLASSYGAILRTRTISNLKEIVYEIYNHIFVAEVYPNVLIRDYARGIILFANGLNTIENIQLEKITPPYASSWYKKEYTTEDIDQLLIEMKSKASNHRSGFDTIVDSMTTEYGRGTGLYGDFGRYVFGHAVKDWNNQFDEQILSNIATKMVLDYGYDEKLHGEYDSKVHYHSRYENLVERIGKKYQWIALYELMARLTDNFPAYKEKRIYSEEYERRQKTNPLFGLSKTFYEEESSIDVSKLTEKEFKQLLKRHKPSSEEIIERRQRDLEEQQKHIVDIEKDYIPYGGPWNPFLRNIDPTLLKYPPMENNNGYLIKFNFPKESDKNWAQSKEEFDHLEDFLYVDYDSKKFVSLAQLLNKQERLNEKIVDRNEFTSKSKAVFIAQSEKEHYIHWKRTEKNDLSASWGSSYSVFAFEYYWHPSIVDEYYVDDHKEIAQEDAVWEYLWESNISSISQERSSCSYFLPNKKLVDYFNLKQTSEGHWKDENINLVAFDANYAGFESNLLFSADYLERYLNDQRLSIVWDFYMEKVSERNRKEEWYIAWENEAKQIEHVVLKESLDTEMKDRF